MITTNFVYFSNELVNFKTSAEFLKRFVSISHQLKHHQSIRVYINLKHNNRAEKISLTGRSKIRIVPL